MIIGLAFFIYGIVLLEKLSSKESHDGRLLPDDKELYGNSKWMMFFSALFIPYTFTFTGYVKEFKTNYIEAKLDETLDEEEDIEKE